MSIPRIAVRTALQMAILAVANLFAGYLNGYGDPAKAISPEDLLAAVQQDRNIILEGLAGIEPLEVAKIRSTYRWLAPEFRKLQVDSGGRWYPYRQVLRAHPLAKYRGHLVIMEQHREWFENQILGALDWLFGKPPE